MRIPEGVLERFKAFIGGLLAVFLAMVLNKAGLDEAWDPWGGLLIVLLFFAGLFGIVYGLGLERYL